MRTSTVGTRQGSRLTFRSEPKDARELKLQTVSHRRELRRPGTTFIKKSRHSLILLGAEFRPLFVQFLFAYAGPVFAVMRTLDLPANWHAGRNEFFR